MRHARPSGAHSAARSWCTGCAGAGRPTLQADFIQQCRVSAYPWTLTRGRIRCAERHTITAPLGGAQLEELRFPRRPTLRRSAPHTAAHARHPSACPDCRRSRPFLRRHCRRNHPRPRCSRRRRHRTLVAPQSRRRRSRLPQGTRKSHPGIQVAQLLWESLDSSQVISQDTKLWNMRSKPPKCGSLQQRVQQRCHSVLMQNTLQLCSAGHRAREAGLRTAAASRGAKAAARKPAAAVPATASCRAAAVTACTAGSCLSLPRPSNCLPPLPCSLAQAKAPANLQAPTNMHGMQNAIHLQHTLCMHP